MEHDASPGYRELLDRKMKPPQLTLVGVPTLRPVAVSSVEQSMAPG